MLAFIYLILMCVLGDTICRRFFTFVSTPHRFATAFLSGLLISSWWTYLSALLFSGTASPMLWGNVVFFITAAALVFWLRSLPARNAVETSAIEGSSQFEKWDWIIIGIFLVFSGWMMFSTFNVTDGVYHIGHHQFPDFGSTVSIMQSFAEGRNFPTEYPHFSGERIRYHFLFYFQAGNLQYLGLDSALSNNLLSVLSLTSLLALIMTLGQVLFNSRVVGRIGAALFFFHGSLAFIPFISSHGSFPELWAKLSTMTQFLSSGLPYRGEDWGVWSQNVYLNQRHLSSSIGIILIVLILLIVRYRQMIVTAAAASKVNGPTGEHVPADASETDNAESFDRDPAASVTDDTDAQQQLEVSDVTSDDEEDDEAESVDDEDNDDDDEEEDDEDDEEGEDEEDSEDNDDDDDDVEDRARLKDVGSAADGSWLGPLQTTAAPFVLAGILLGLLPLWNGAIFTSAFVILAVLFVLFPIKREMITMGIITAVLALPQIWFLKSGARETGYSLLYWGYTIDNGSITEVLYYMMFTFGFKWLLIALAIYFADGLQRRVMIAISALIVVTFCFRFSEEVLVNHKFLNVWLVIANCFVAYGIVRLWRAGSANVRVPIRVLTAILVFLITIGGAIDLMPIKNSYSVMMKHDGDKLVEWIQSNTDPNAIFLSHRYINHQILLAGRKLFYGEPYYPWSAGYDTEVRDKIYRKMFESQDPNEVFNLLKENNIDYVAVDEMIRSGRSFINKPNETMLKAYFKLVFDDTDRQYANIKIYQVPDQLGAPDPSIKLDGTDNQPVSTPNEPVADAFTGGVGSGHGQFVTPRGIVADLKGNFYIADTNNARIQKFDAAGKFLMAFGTPGSGSGELKEPNGVAVDDAGNIFVTDSLNHKLLKYDPEGKFVKEWIPEGGFYGPRDISFGPNKQLYIIDQGRTRIAVFDPVTESFTAWGTGGSNEGEFNEATGIAIGDGRIYVSDTGNMRLQVFDLNGAFLKQWPVPSWEPSTIHFPDVVYDDILKRIYVTSGKLNQILAFDVEGNAVSGFPGEGSDKLQNPTSLYISGAKSARKLLVLNTSSGQVTAFDLAGKTEK